VTELTIMSGPGADVLATPFLASKS
jgi:hypothetical protein